MNIKKAIKYQGLEMKKSVIVYYGMIYATFILLAIFMGIQNNGIQAFKDYYYGVFGVYATDGGMEVLTIIFMFTIALNSFKDGFKMFLQNGLSRGTLFKSFILNIIPLSIFMSLIDSITTAIAGPIFKYDSMYFHIYGRRYTESVGEVTKVLEGFMWQVSTYLTVAMIGYFIAILYYRMDKKLTMIVSVGVAIFLLFALPIIEFNITSGAITRTMGRVIRFVSGVTSGYNPYYYMISSILVFVVFGGLSYGLMRKAVVKPTYSNDLLQLY